MSNQSTDPGFIEDDDDLFAHRSPLSGWRKTIIKGWADLKRRFNKPAPMEPVRDENPIPDLVVAASQPDPAPVSTAAPVRSVNAVAVSNLLRRKLQVYDENLGALQAEITRLKPFEDEVAAVPSTGSAKLSINPFEAGSFAAFTSAAQDAAEPFELCAEITNLNSGSTTTHYGVNYGVPATLQVTDSLYFYNLRFFYTDREYYLAFMKLRTAGVDLFADRRLNKLIPGDTVSERFHKWLATFLGPFKK